MYILKNGWTQELMVARINQYVPSHGCWIDDNNRNVILYNSYGVMREVRCAASAMMPHEYFTDPETKGYLTTSIAGLSFTKFKEIEKHLPLDQIEMSVLQREHDDYSAKINSPSLGSKLPAHFNLKEHLISWIRTNCISERQYQAQQVAARV